MKTKAVVIPALPQDTTLAETKRSPLVRSGFEVSVITSPGLARATREGIASSWGDIVVVMDCDDLHPVYLASALVRLLEIQEFDLMKASRINFGSDLKGIISRLGNKLVKRVLDLPVSDSTTCFYAGYKDKLLELPDSVWQGHGDYMMALLYEAKKRNWRIGEYKYVAPMDHREGSTSLKKHLPMYLRRIKEIRNS